MTIHLLPPQIPAVAPIDEVRETAFRRRIYVELQRLQDILIDNPMDDEMTESIRVWVGEFKSALLLRRVEAQIVFDEFVPLLQELLRDPIYHAPLDKKALLGSDGYTYGKITLTVYLASIPEEERHRSPINGENPGNLFTTEPHPFAREMVKWLEEHERLLHNLEMENAYQNLVAQGRVPVIPTRETERMRMMRERFLERRRRRQDRREGLLGQLDALRAERDREIQQLFGNIQNHIDQLHQNNQQRLAAIQEEMIEQEVEDIDINQERERLQHVNDELQERLHELQNTIGENGEEQIVALQQREEVRAQVREEQVEAFEQRLTAIQTINHQQRQQELDLIREQGARVTQTNLQRLNTIQSNDQRQGQEQQRNITQLNNRVSHAQAEAEELKKRQWKMEKEILKTKEENLKLQIAVEKTKKAIKGKNRGKGKALATAIAGAVVCGGATVGVQSLVSSAAPGVQGFVSPISGGAKITISVGL